MKQARFPAGTVADSKDKFKGSLVGCAIGDALGAPLEGLSAREIFERYGTVRDFLDARFGAGLVTDDTQMTVVLTQALLEAGRFSKSHVALKFGRWLELSESGIKEARGTGRGCAEACRRIAEGASADESGVGSAGCGAAMRVAPLGLLYFDDAEALSCAAVEQALITHTDPGAVAGSVAVAHAVASGITDVGEIEPSGFLDGIAFVVERIDPEMSRKVAGLADYLDASLEEGFAYTGAGGLACETVPAALFSFIHSPYDFEATVIAAVNAGGDTDSIGAIAAAISGAHNGLACVPGRWEEGVEGGRYIAGLAFRLWTLSGAFKPEPRALF